MPGNWLLPTPSSPPWVSLMRAEQRASLRPGRHRGTEPSPAAPTPFCFPGDLAASAGVLLQVTPQSCQVASQRGLKVDPPDASERWGPGPHVATRVSWSPSWKQMAQPGLLPGTVASLCSAQVPGPLPLRLLGVLGVGHRAWASQVLAVGLNDGGDASAPSPGPCDEGVCIHPCKTNK